MTCSKCEPVQLDLFPKELAEAKFEAAIRIAGFELALHIDRLVFAKLLNYKGTNGTSN